MKLGGIDKDGLDLMFTLGEGTYDIRRAKTDAPDRFKTAMTKAWPSSDFHSIATDMSHTLGQIFSNYLGRLQKKRTTLLIVTDGVWDGPTPKNRKGEMEVDKVETTIVDFIYKMEGIRLLEKKYFTIQFIRVGDEKNAAERLQRFDDDLEKIYEKKKVP